MTDDKLKALRALDVAPRAKGSNYPPAFQPRVAGRIKRQLGDAFGLTNFGVNLTVLEPGAESALMHRHGVQDEFVYILEGRPTLALESEEIELAPGMCAGFPANGEAHHLVNRTSENVVYLEIGDRLPGDSGEYPQDDIVAVRGEAGWSFTRKDGSSY